MKILKQTTCYGERRSFSSGACFAQFTVRSLVITAIQRLIRNGHLFGGECISSLDARTASAACETSSFHVVV